MVTGFTRPLSKVETDDITIGLSRNSYVRRDMHQTNKKNEEENYDLNTTKKSLISMENILKVRL